MNIRHEAYDIIVKVLKLNEYSDNLLHQRTKRLMQNDGEHIAFLYQLVKGTVKYKLHLDYICRQFTDTARFEKTDLKIKVLLYMGIYQLKFMKSVPDHAAVHETVELGKTLFGESVANFVNSVLRSYLRTPQLTYPPDMAQRIAYEYSYPVELIRTWLNNWGEEKAELLAMYCNEPSELHLRVNTLATDAKKLIQYFTKRNILCTQSNICANILISHDAIAVLGDVAFSEGYYSVQDTSAALIVELLDPHPEESILDLFAAPGGKCTYISELMKNTGEIIAVDKAPSKMKLLKQAIERLQLDNIRLNVQDAFSYGPVAPAFHRVLLDAPCSGWGVFGRKADLRWQKHQQLEDLIRLQEKALNYAANFVKLNGCLVYSTCTLNPEENEMRIEQFLKKNNKFILVDAKQFIPEKITQAGYMSSIPYLHFMDGAFAARLKRIK